MKSIERPYLRVFWVLRCPGPVLFRPLFYILTNALSAPLFLVV